MTAGVGLFGKLPAHGDFVVRGMTAAERTACDAWLSASLSRAQGDWGDDFAARYEAAAPWCFACNGRAGALALSADAAGRRFPLFLSVAAAAPAAVGVAQAVEALAWEAIAGRWTADTLAEGVAAIDVGPTATGALPVPERWWCPAHPDAAVPDGDDMLISAMLAAMEPTA